MSRTAVSLVVLAAGLVLLLVLVPGVPLLAFAAALLAVGLRAAADPLAARTGLPGGAAVGLVLLAAFGLLALVFALAAPGLAEQVNELVRRLPEAAARLRERIEGAAWGRALLDGLEPGALLRSSGSAAGGALLAATGTAAALTDAGFMLVLGIFLALAPATYLDGLARLVAPEGRDAFRAVLAQVGHVLRGWLAGQAIAMAAVGTLVWLGLSLLGVAPAGALAAIAGLLTFVPVIGAIVGAVPAVLVAAGQDLALVPWVIALFVAAQAIEGNLITPIAQRRTARLQPGLLLLFQLAMVGLFGLSGILVAAPVAAATAAAVRTAYVERWLEAGSGAISPRA